MYNGIGIKPEEINSIGTLKRDSCAEGKNFGKDIGFEHRLKDHSGAGCTTRAVFNS